MPRRDHKCGTCLDLPAPLPRFCHGISRECVHTASKRYQPARVQ